MVRHRPQAPPSKPSQASLSLQVAQLTADLAAREHALHQAQDSAEQGKAMLQVGLGPVNRMAGVRVRVMLQMGLGSAGVRIRARPRCRWGRAGASEGGAEPEAIRWA